MTTDTFPEVYTVAVKMPGHIFSEVSQDLRDKIEEFMNQNGIRDDEVDSVYSSDPAAESKTRRDRLAAVRYLNFTFINPQHAILFKLTFG